MSLRRPRLRSRRPAAALACSLLLSAGVGGCAPTAEERQTARQSAAREGEWIWLQQAKRTLDQQRARLAGQEAGNAELARRSEALAAELNRRLVELINADPPVQGEPLSQQQQAAIRMKSDEDIRLAQQFIAQGGDYQRAIDIYNEALAVDPGNPRLREELAKARARRYMTRQLFTGIREGMDQPAVRRLLGQPNLHNVREYPGLEVVGWFYPKDESGAAAAVWFHIDGGRYTVYLSDFDALQPRSPAEPPPVPHRST